MIDPVLMQEDTPDHGVAFWADLDQVLQSEASTATVEVPAVGVAPTSRTRSRAVWPLVAAAAALAIAGLSVLFFRGGTDPSINDVVSGPEERGGIPLGEPDTSVDVDANGAVPAIAGPTALPEPSPTVVAMPSEATAEQPVPAHDLGDLPTYEVAAGNTATSVYLPAQPFPDGTRLLGTFEAARLSWFSIVDPTTGCHDPDYAEIRYVPDGGFNFALADPNPRFSGNISQFTPAYDIAKIAWLAECDGQLELYVADAGPIAGQASNIRLAWSGMGSSIAASMVWQGPEITLNSIDPSGQAFFVSADLDAETVTGSGVRSDVGDGTGRSSWIVGGSASGDLTWWNGVQAGGVATCDGQALFLHSDISGWQPAFIDPTAAAEAVNVAAVTKFALNPDLAQVGFTDDCGGINTAHVFLGTVRADGAISSVRTIDLSQWATGHVSLLHWEDPLTLRIHVDDSNTGGAINRFNYVFDDGRENGVLVQLN